MKAFNILAAGAVALAASSGSAAPGQMPGKSDSAEGLASAPLSLNRTFLIGLWTDDDDCEHAVEFLGDGRYFSGSSGGIWQLDGNELTLTSDNILVIRVVPLDDDTIGVLGEDGSVGESTRCQTADIPAPGPDEVA